ncbi:hypothetical protein JDV09_23285 [Mycobacterium sp. Y57]|nr:hypothetical protein [Mycolicibacterium xanthum]
MPGEGDASPGDTETAETAEATESAEATETAEAADADGATAEATETAGPSAPTAGRRTAANVAVIALVVALLASAGLAGWLFFGPHRTDQAIDAAAADVALEAAKTGTAALLSYSPESLDEDFATAKSHLTGDFLDYYTDFTEKVVKPAAQEKAVNTSAKIVLGAVSQLQPDSAEVLLFVNQITMSKENPDGAFAASSVKVGLQKIDGNWLISSFDPV